MCVNCVGRKIINTTNHRDVDPRTKGGKEEGSETGKGEELQQLGLKRRLSGTFEFYPITLPWFWGDLQVDTYF